MPIGYGSTESLYPICIVIVPFPTQMHGRVARVRSSTAHETVVILVYLQHELELPI